ncbi:MAG: glycosyl hydrolase 53 family protein [Bacteroidales bacterium]
MKRIITSVLIPLVILAVLSLPTSCKKEDILGKTQFVMGADLSYVNQILEHGGVYRDNGQVKDPYTIFKDHGANLVRLRLWHTPTWTKEVYGNAGIKMYNDLADVKVAIRRSREAGLAVNLDFHYSDTWADPQKQGIPAAWMGIDFKTLSDSVYQYTYKTLKTLSEEGLMPEMVQVGNEINPGMLLPLGSYTANGWPKLGELINSGIRAVRDVSILSEIKPLIILHVAQPENVKFWFTNITATGAVTDFDVLGFSYYSKWSDVPMEEISKYVADFKKTFNKEVMVVETAYPWTGQNADSYGNIFNAGDAEPGYPITPEGQLKYMIDLTQAIMDGGGMGVMVWEPAWISSSARDPWGTGSAWENCTFFDFGGNVNQGIGFMQHKY